MSAEQSTYWRSLEELADDDQFAFALGREFPEYADRLRDGPTRRQFLQLMGASLALAGAGGCVQQPQEQIISHVRSPEQLSSGKPLYYATTITHDGTGVGILAKSHMGRPIKIEGNPLHPAVPEIMRAANDRAGDNRVRFGATDVFSQAAVLSLYDPDRSQTVLRARQVDTWSSFVAAVQARLAELAPAGGRGLRILTEPVVSPTLAGQLSRLVELYPNAQWHQYTPVHRDNELAGSRLAFNADYEPIHRIERADVILSLDADFLAEGPMHLQHARAFAGRRDVNPRSGGVAGMNRLYMLETTATLTGAAADHRLPMRPTNLAATARSLAFRLGVPIEDAPVNRNPVVDTIVDELQSVRGRSLVLAGRRQPPPVHALAHAMNATLGNAGQTTEYRRSPLARPELMVESLQSLINAMRAGEVSMLMILGGNPAYDAPADFRFADALASVPTSIHLSDYDNETSDRCTWHVPATHVLESWGDTRAADGTVSITQPLIAPLYGGKTPHELVSILTGNTAATSYDIVRGHWQAQHAASGLVESFDSIWKIALHNGTLGSASPVEQPTLRRNFAERVSAELMSADEERASAAGFQIVFQPDASVWDGRFANNGWLQELPRPFTKLTWDNAAILSPRTATEQQLATGDVIDITLGGVPIEIPVFVVPTQPPDTLTLHLGYGRRRAGRVGNGVGTNVYALRTSGAMWFAAGATLRKTGRRHVLATTQHHHLMEGRHLVRAGSLDQFRADSEHPSFMAAGHEPAPSTSLYPEHKYDGYKWGMSVDLSKCIGCNACVIACQAENNIPVVGRDQVARGREMHWLRIDQYYEGEPDDAHSYHQPVMCQHCELAPCEPVCPVAATTHSSEGLNEMTYNRCVGTRYCSNNCPYKVRRFNFLEYNMELKGDATLQLRTNPDVTVRSRGVMEKCTYCVQRINAARIEAEKQDRKIRDGDVVTACQAACPSEAIVFGNLNDATSEVLRLAASKLNYALLGELNTRPRTTYLAAVRNPTLL
jgi:molybdopterin-containing oxidoreductase family iron-sulfur binding subunit